MNIYILDTDPIKSAYKLLARDKRRAHKMVIEIFQACAYLAEKYKQPHLVPTTNKGEPYKTALASRFPKPLLKFMNDRTNYNWVMETIEVIVEHRNDLNQYKNLLRCIHLSKHIKQYRHCTPFFVNYAKSKEKGLDFTHIKDVCEAYDLYLKAQGV